MSEYRYLGDRMTDPALKGAGCVALRRTDGKCIRGRNGSMLVQFAGEATPRVVIGRLLRKIPLKLNVTIAGPFRALIGTAKSISDPRRLINDVLPRPLDDVPGIVTEVRRIEESEQKTQTPVPEQVITAPPPDPSER